jgi:hypothetical protein
MLLQLVQLVIVLHFNIRPNVNVPHQRFHTMRNQSKKGANFFKRQQGKPILKPSLCLY